MADEITLTIPSDRDSHGVAPLVLGGLASRLNITLEHLEDLQIAIDAVLVEAALDGDVSVTMCLRGDELETTIGPVDVAAALERGRNEIALGRVLDTVVDYVELDGAYVLLRKR